MEKIEQEDFNIPGPRAAYVCGYGEDKRKIFEDLWNSLGEEPLNFFQTRQGQSAELVGTVLTEEGQTPVMEEGKLPYAVLFAGLPFSKVRTFMRAFKQTGLPRPIFSTATEHNLKFTVKELLAHLLEDQREVMDMRKRMQEEQKNGTKA